MTRRTRKFLNIIEKGYHCDEVRFCASQLLLDITNHRDFRRSRTEFFMLDELINKILHARRMTIVARYFAQFIHKLYGIDGGLRDQIFTEKIDIYISSKSIKGMDLMEIAEYLQNPRHRIKDTAFQQQQDLGRHLAAAIKHLLQNYVYYGDSDD